MTTTADRMTFRMVLALAIAAVLCLWAVTAQGGQAKRTTTLTEVNERVNELERRIANLEQVVMTQHRQTSLREQFERRQAADRQKYSAEQLREAEELYQAMNKQWNSPVGKAALEKLVERYPDINRTGCAYLYLGRVSEGDDKEKNLKIAVGKYSDCIYGDGVQVGAYARYLLAEYYKEIGEIDEAESLIKQLKTSYPLAIDHRGRLLVEPRESD